MGQTRWLVVFLLLTISTGSVTALDSGDEYYITIFSCMFCDGAEEMKYTIISEWLESYQDLVVVDYDTGFYPVNERINKEYSVKYNVSYDLPKAFVSENLTFFGVDEILISIPIILEDHISESSLYSLESLNISSLKGHPMIWHGDRVFINSEPDGDGKFILELIRTGNINDTLWDHPYEVVPPSEVMVSPNNYLTFKHAVRVDGWVVQWAVDESSEEVLIEETPGDTKGKVSTPFSAIMALAGLMALGIRTRSDLN